MHNAIENENRNVAVYTLNDWILIFKTVQCKRVQKRNDPCDVQELKYKDKTVNINDEKVKYLPSGEMFSNWNC